MNWKHNSQIEIGNALTSLYQIATKSADPEVVEIAKALFDKATNLSSKIRESKWVHAEEGEMAQPII